MNGSDEVVKVDVLIFHLMFCSRHTSNQAAASLCFCLTCEVALALSGPCPLFSSSCQNCQPYLPPVRPSWRLKEKEEKGVNLNRMSTDASSVEHISIFQMMPLHLLISELFFNLAYSVALVACWRVFPNVLHCNLGFTSIAVELWRVCPVILAFHLLQF